VINTAIGIVKYISVVSALAIACEILNIYPNEINELMSALEMGTELVYTITTT